MSSCGKQKQFLPTNTAHTRLLRHSPTPCTDSALFRGFLFVVVRVLLPLCIVSISLRFYLTLSCPLFFIRAPNPSSPFRLPRSLPGSAPIPSAMRIDFLCAASQCWPMHKTVSLLLCFVHLSHNLYSGCCHEPFSISTSESASMSASAARVKF